MRIAPISLRSLPSLLFLCMFAVACSGGGGDDDDGDIPDGGAGGGVVSTSQFVVSAVTDSDGRALATIGIPAGIARYSITAQSSAPFIRTEHVVSGDVVYLNISGEFISLATEFQNVLGTVNVPSRDFDPSARSGPVDVIVTAASDATETGFTPAAQVQVDFVVTTKSDPDLRSGTLALNVFRVGDAAVTADAAAAIESAITRMEDIYRDQAGITVQTEVFDLAGPEKLPFPFEGGELYLSSSQGARTPAVNIFVGAEIDLDVGFGTLLGVAASIPGPSHPTTKSAVAVSLVGNAGPDGVFSESERRILGETFAHESGHFLGLFHPIELDGLIGFFASGEDSLTDTETCAIIFECIENENLAHNLMFPTPLPAEDGGTIPQDRLTSQQRGVLNLNAIVN